MVILLLLAFVGQTLASTAVTCHAMKTMDMSERMMMSHSMESGPSVSDSKASKNVADCCQQDCNCSMGLSVSATLSSSAFIDSWVLLSQKIEQYTNILLSHSLTSPYRPPIT